MNSIGGHDLWQVFDPSIKEALKRYDGGDITEAKFTALASHVFVYLLINMEKNVMGRFSYKEIGLHCSFTGKLSCNRYQELSPRFEEIVNSYLPSATDEIIRHIVHGLRSFVDNAIGDNISIGQKSLAVLIKSLLEKFYSASDGITNVDDAAKAMAERISKLAHPAYAEIQKLSDRYAYIHFNSEFLTDFSALLDGGIILAMESEGKPATTIYSNIRNIEAGSIYWDFLKLLSTQAESKALICTAKIGDHETIRRNFTKMLSEFIVNRKRDPGEVQVCIFDYESFAPKSVPTFTTYTVERDASARQSLTY